MRINDHLCLVTSGSLGLDLSDPLDCNAYLVLTSSGWLMFDAGAGRTTSASLSRVAALGIDPATICALLLTHGHADHSGGALHVRKTLDIPVIAGEATARMVRTGDEDAISLTGARQSGGYPQDFLYHSCQIDQTLTDGQQLAFGDTHVTTVATPGHSHDHMSFLLEGPAGKMLLSGDALFHGGLVGVQDVYDCSVPQICASVRRLASLDYEVFLPGHGAFSLTNGRRHADAAMAFVTRGACPPSI